MPFDLPTVLLGLSVFALAFFGVGVIATVRHTRPRAAAEDAKPLPPVSILKPLKGCEEQLADNLRSFFAQDYPAFEIVFSTAEPDDDALPVARQVAAEFPNVPVKFVRSDPNFGLNPKVANLEGALRYATHDLVLQSDANVRAKDTYLRDVVSELVSSKASLLSSMVVGTGECSAGAAMENLQLSAMIAPSTCFALHYFGVTCVIGKSMLFRKSELESVGGLERVKDILAEDYILGRIYQKAGRGVLLSATTAENVNVSTTVDRFFSRHTRWLKMRAVIHPPAFVAELFANPVALAFAAVVTSGCRLDTAIPAVVVVASKVALDAWVVKRTRGVPMAARHLAFAPIKDLLLLAILPYAAISRSIEWRGVKLRLGWGSTLRPDDGALPVRVARRMWSAIAP